MQLVGIVENKFLKEKSSGEGKDLFSAAPDDQTRVPQLRRQCR